MNRPHAFLALSLAGCLVAASPSWAQSSSTATRSAATAPASKPAVRGSALLGSWKSTEAPQGTLTGRIVFSADGRAVLAADGQPELNGRWSVPAPGQLSFEMPPHGTAHMRFEQPKPSVLVLTYENGTRQTFNKEAPSK